jgi:hypothetical protein
VAAAAIACALVAWQRCGGSAHAPSGSRSEAPGSVASVPWVPRGGATDPRRPAETRDRARLSGHVTWPTGAPVPGARVWIERDPTAEVVAGPDGAFSFDVAPGGYVLGAQHEHAVSGAWPVAISADPASNAPIRIMLRPGVTLRVSVLSPAQEPVQGAQLEVLGQRAQATTDARGEAEIEALAPGELEVRVSAAGYPVDVTTTHVDVFGAASHLTVRLRAGFSVAGQVIDGSGAGVAGARLIACRTCLESELAATNVAATDASGQFELRDVASGAQTVRVVDPRGRFAPPLLIEVSAPVSGLTLVVSAPISDEVRATLEPAEATLAGRVVDTARQPLPGLCVELAPDAGVIGPSPSTMTAGDGSFAFDRLPAGDYRITVATAGCLHNLGELVAGAGDRAVVIQVARTGTLAGSVVHEDGSRPRFGASLTNDKGAGAHLAGLTGAFRIDDLPPGVYELTISGPGFGDLRREVSIDAGAETDVGSLVVRGGRTLTGVVVDDHGAPVGGAKVLVDQPYDAGVIDDVRMVITDAAGRFALRGIPVRTTLLAAGAEDPRTGCRSMRVPIPDGTADPAPVRLVIRPCGSIAGTVSNDAGPLAGAMIGCGEPEVAMAITDARGRFTMPIVPPGEHSLTIYPPRARPVVRDVRVDPGQRRELAIEL